MENKEEGGGNGEDQQGIHWRQKVKEEEVGN